MKSTDGGRTWARLGTNTLPAIVWDLAIDPSDPSTVYAGTHAGVYVSRDAGIHWNPMNDGLISGFVYSIEVGPTGSPLYAGAAGGVFRFDVAPS